MRINNKPTREIILEVIAADPRAADDDALLIAKVWYMKGWKDPNLYKLIKSVPNPETIRRTRAKLVEEGKITPSAKAQAARAREEQQARQDLGYTGRRAY